MFDNVKESLRARISPTSTHWAALRKDVRTRLHFFKKERDPYMHNALEQDFALVLCAWGLEEEDIPRVLRELRLRTLVLALPVVVCLCAALLTQQPAVWLTVALVLPPCIFGTLTTAWRISVLKKRSFTPLGRWLCLLVSLGKKGA